MQYNKIFEAQCCTVPKTLYQGMLTDKSKWCSSFISGKGICTMLFYAVESARNGRYRQRRNLRSSTSRKRRANMQRMNMEKKDTWEVLQEIHKSLATQPMEKVLEIEKEQRHMVTASPHSTVPATLSNLSANTEQGHHHSLWVCACFAMLF